MNRDLDAIIQDDTSEITLDSSTDVRFVVYVKNYHKCVFLFSASSVDDFSKLNDD